MAKVVLNCTKINKLMYKGPTNFISLSLSHSIVIPTQHTKTNFTPNAANYVTPTVFYYYSILLN